MRLTGGKQMQPDAAGLALATGVLAAVIAAFGLASWLISGAVTGLSYAIGLAVARGIAEWAAPEPDPLAAASGSPDGLDGADGLPPVSGEDGDRADHGGPDTPSVRLARVVGGRPRLRLECRPAR